MATLNLSKMKYMSETNLKKFANLIISLSSQVTDVENKCIKPYVDGELYPRDSYVSYNGYIYQATATNQDSVFDETHWDKLSDDFNELTVADIESMLGLSQEQLETMADLIADTEVRLDKTYSSSKIYQDIQQCLNDSKAFTLLELGKFSGASYKVVASTSEMTSESIIYLLASGNTYDMYIVEENGATTKIGDMNIDLSDYYTKAEIEADYLKKADADGKYATIVTVDSKVDKTDIVDNLTSIDIDKPLSANQGKVLKDEVDLKANASEVVKKTDISTSIDSTSTDDKVPSTKSVYTNILSLLRNQSMTEEKVNSNIETFYIGTIPSDVGQAIGLPITNGIYTKIINIPHGMYTIQLAWDIGKHNNIFMLRKCNNGVWGIWQKVCTTTVADVNETSIEFDETALGLTIVNSHSLYKVINGICYVTIEINVVPPTENKIYGYTKISTTSIPKIGFSTKATLNVVESNSSISAVLDRGDTIIKLHGNILAREGSCIIQGSFSYPVAE